MKTNKDIKLSKTDELRISFEIEQVKGKAIGMVINEKKYSTTEEMLELIDKEFTELVKSYCASRQFDLNEANKNIENLKRQIK